MGLLDSKRDDDWQEQQEHGLLARLKSAVQSTRQNLTVKIDALLRRRKQFDHQTQEELEEILIGADVGVKTTFDVLERVKTKIQQASTADPATAIEWIRQEFLAVLTEATVRSAERSRDAKPRVLFVVGVNGAGKTTTIGKLAWRLKTEGKSAILCAADTYRAAAGDQLAIWAERAGIPIIQQRPGADPSAVVYDAIAAARSRDTDVVIVDTAGRLHNKVQLMKELEKMARVAGKALVGAPHEVLLVIDAVTGENGIEQARQFSKVMPVTGLVLTKLDGTAKGGVVISIARELNVPIRFVGVGEGIDDLLVFSPEQFINSLFDLAEPASAPLTA